MGGLLVVVAVTLAGCSSTPRLPECRGPWRQINAPLLPAGASTSAPAVAARASAAAAPPVNETTR